LATASAQVCVPLGHSSLYFSFITTYTSDFAGQFSCSVIIVGREQTAMNWIWWKMNNSKWSRVKAMDGYECV